MPVFRSSSRSLKRVLVSSVVLAGAAVALPALPARADTETMTATVLNDTLAVLIGTSGADHVSMHLEGENYAHNRFTAGDPGFESDTDWDSSTPGIQVITRTQVWLGQRWIRVNTLDGDDSLVTVGSDTEQFYVPQLDMGAGNDTLDMSGMTSAVNVGGNTQTKLTTVETIIGSPFDDTILAQPNQTRSTPLTILGGAGNDMLVGSSANDTIIGGPGFDRVASKGGNDVIVLSALPPTMLDVDGGPGTDQLIVQGTTDADAMEVAGYPGEFWTFDLMDTNRGYHALNTEKARLDLGNGDDFAFVSSQLATTGVVGGAGTDQVIVDAFKSTATITTVGSLKRITAPLANRTPITNLSAVEQYAIADETVIGTAPTPGGGPHVRTFRVDGTPVANFYAYDAGFTGGVTLGMGDLDGDADDEIITAAGPGGGPHVRVFYSDGTDTGVQWYAYDPSFNGGVSVAAIDVNGDGVDEIVTAPAKNSEPRIRIWTGSGELVTEWNAQGFGTSGLKVARGAHNGYFGGDEILLSAADGEQSVVRAFDADGELAAEYDPYVPYGTFAGGASVARGEFKGGANKLVSDEVITGAGAGGGPVVRVAQLAPNTKTLSTIGNFFAYDSSYTGGIEVSACNPDGGNDEIVTVPAHGAAPWVRMFNLDGSVKRKGFFAYDKAFTNGIHVVCGGAISRFFGGATPAAKAQVTAQSVAPKGVAAAKVAAS